MARRLTFDAQTCLACKSCELACVLAHSASGALEPALGESPRPEPRVELVLRSDGLAALRCAHQGSPSGGPVDKIPPEIIRVYPEKHTLHYRDSKLAIEFSKYVDRRSVEGSIFISPSLGALAFDWGGKDVEIGFAGSLRDNTTYILTVGTDVVDMRNRNRMANAYSLAFSTGDHIDSGTVAGRVLDAKPEGVMVFGYRLNDMNPDTLDPSHSEPDYLTQTGKDGSFVLGYLKLGRYRLLAVRDEYKNLLYDKQTDEYGTAQFDISLSADKPLLRGIQFKITREDTTVPFLSNARALDRNHVLLRFSKQMDTSGADYNNVSMFDTTSGEGIRVVDLSFVPRSATPTGEVVQPSEAELVTADQDSLKMYRVTVRGFKDTDGNPLREHLATCLFAGSSVPDTIKPAVSFMNVSEGSKNLLRGDSIQIRFSEPIQISRFSGGFALVDSGGKVVRGKLIWRNSMAVTFVPESLFAFGMPYKISVVLDSVVDAAGNAYRDSTRTVKFRAIDESLLGSIRGTVLVDSAVVTGSIVVIAAPISRNDARLRQLILARPGEFAFDELQEGKYVLSAFNDADGNGIYSFGKPFPFKAAERFTLYPDTLKVRARWPLEGVGIHFR